jgi:hypothetical protein
MMGQVQKGVPVPESEQSTKIAEPKLHNVFQKRISMMI